MKKLMACLLALVLLALSPLALAQTIKLTENASGFDLTVDIPDDAVVAVQTYDDVPYTFITYADATLPKIYLSVAPTEEYDVSSVADLSKADLDTLFESISADMDSPSYTMEKTAGGYDYMLINDDTYTDSAMLILLYKGYFIQETVWNENYAVLGDDDYKTAETLIDSLKIIDVK